MHETGNKWVGTVLCMSTAHTENWVANGRRLCEPPPHTSQELHNVRPEESWSNQGKRVCLSGTHGCTQYKDTVVHTDRCGTDTGCYNSLRNLFCGLLICCVLGAIYVLLGNWKGNCTPPYQYPIWWFSFFPKNLLEKVWSLNSNGKIVKQMSENGTCHWLWCN